MKKHFNTFIVLICSFNSFSQDTLQEIKVQKNDRKSLKNHIATANTTTLTSKELLKAACCNLAESFENPSIDVNFSDALTGRNK
jgi:hypothetical protein